MTAREDQRNHRANALAKLGVQPRVTLPGTSLVYVRSVRVLGQAHRIVRANGRARTGCGSRLIGGDIITAADATLWVMQPCRWCYPWWDGTVRPETR